MELKPEFKTINDMLSLEVEYIIPRFQREYSWQSDELNTLWNDLIDAIEINGNNITISEYFLGSIVFVKDEADPKSRKRYVVDGQQRLTTITIMISALVKIFDNIDKTENADILHKFIITKDSNAVEYTKLRTSTSNPFFQYTVQKRIVEEKEPKTLEEKNINYARLFFIKKFSARNLRQEFSNYFDADGEYFDLLLKIKDQLLGCKIMSMTEENYEDAYLIFEVLNAKGKTLSAIDIIKNRIFGKLNVTEPEDFPNILWKNIKKNINEIGETSIELFFRQYWISKYSFSTHKNLVKEFSKIITPEEKDYKVFLEEFEKSSNNYKKICNPNPLDYNAHEIKFEYLAFSAITKVFSVIQARTVLLSLYETKQNKMISHKDYKNAIINIEKFLFIFSKITSERASRFERKFSSFSINLRKCQNKNESNQLINEFISNLNELLPSYEEYLIKFKELNYIDDKPVIQYIFRKIEYYYRKTYEIESNSLTLEHIMPKSSTSENKNSIGNLVPIEEVLNLKCDNSDFKAKKEIYKKSNYLTMKQFLKNIDVKSDWTEEDIALRSEIIAKLMFEDLWI